MAPASDRRSAQLTLREVARPLVLLQLDEAARGVADAGNAFAARVTYGAYLRERGGNHPQVATTRSPNTV